VQCCAELNCCVKLRVAGWLVGLALVCAFVCAFVSACVLSWVEIYVQQYRYELNNKGCCEESNARAPAARPHSLARRI
jgi:hypothetical protein